MTAHLRDQLAIAEARLRNARDNLENSAKRYGESLAGIFSDTFFVPRSVAERWLDNTEHKFLEREAQNFQHVKAALQKLAAKKQAGNDDGDDPNPYPGDEGDDGPHTPPDKSKKGKKKAAPTGDDVEEAEKAARFFASRDAPGKRVPVDREVEVEALYRNRYGGFTAKHFHEHLVRGHHFAWGYTWTKTFRHSKGLLERAERRGAHRRKRPRRPMPGRMLHQPFGELRRLAARLAWRPEGA